MINIVQNKNTSIYEYKHRRGLNDDVLGSKEFYNIVENIIYLILNNMSSDIEYREYVKGDIRAIEYNHLFCSSHLVGKEYGFIGGVMNSVHMSDPDKYISTFRFKNKDDTSVFCTDRLLTFSFMEEESIIYYNFDYPKYVKKIIYVVDESSDEIRIGYREFKFKQLFDDKDTK